ncbi:MAG TPA: aspartyl protease family protein [Yeosuana sp.]
MYNFLRIILLIFCFNNFGFSQGRFVIQNKYKSDKINFKLLNNLVIIPVKVNDVDLSFILDTGVSKTIIFNYSNISDSLKIKDTELIYLRGLGEGDSVEALKSKNNNFRIGDAVNIKQELFAIFNEDIDFAPRLGIAIHGIIGYDLFKDLIVEINYTKKFVRLTEPDKFQYKNCRKCETLSLEFYNNKPYVNAHVKIESNNIPIKLLIDSGGSDALWLFEDDTLGIRHSDKFFNDFLGHGLSGSVYGKRSKVEEFSLNKFVLKNANVAFPDASSISFARKFKDRNGSLAGNILKRFNIIFDYQKAKMIIRKNSYFKHEFSYNKSGIELAQNGVRFIKEIDYQSGRNNGLTNDESNNAFRIIFDSSYKFYLKPAYTIVELRENSPAYNAGLLIGDIILSINGKSAHQYSLQGLMQKFYEKEGKRIKLTVERNGQVFSMAFRLEKLFK